MRITFLFFLVLGSSFAFAENEPDFIEFTTSFKRDSNKKIIYTHAEIRDEAHLKRVLEYFKKITKDSPQLFIDTAFYDPKTLKKHGFPENEAVSSVEKNIGYYFKGHEIRKEVLSEKLLTAQVRRRSPSQSKPQNIFKEQELKKSIIFFGKRYRVSLTISRFVVGGSVSAAAMAAVGVPIEIAMTYGAIVGSLSATIQWKFEDFTKFFSTNEFTGSWRNAAIKKLPFLRQLGFKEVEVGRESKFLPAYAKWGSFELIFIGVIETTLNSLSMLDLITYYTSLGDAVKHAALNTGSTIGSQGIWEASVAKMLDPSIRRMERSVNELWLELTEKTLASFDESSLVAESRKELLLKLVEQKKLESRFALSKKGSPETASIKKQLKNMRKEIKSLRGSLPREEVKVLDREFNDLLYNQKSFTKYTRLKNLEYNLTKNLMKKSSLALFGSAMWSVSIVLNMMGLHTESYWAFGSLTAAGAINYAKIYFDQSSHPYVERLRKIKGNLKGYCQSLLH